LEKIKNGVIMRPWIRKMFASKIVAKKGLVRRKKSHIDKCNVFDDLLNEVKKKRFHLIETGDQYIIICNAGRFKVHC
jgi:hypothetical protein